MRHKNAQGQIVLPKMTSQSEFTFSLTLEGKWDWNKDIAGPVPGDTFNASFLSPCTIKGDKGGDLVKAFQNELAEYVFGRCERMFETARLHNATFTPDMQAAYQAAREALAGADRVAAERELAEVEAKAARLRKALGK